MHTQLFPLYIVLRRTNTFYKLYGDVQLQNICPNKNGCADPMTDSMHKEQGQHMKKRLLTLIFESFDSNESYNVRHCCSRHM